MKIYTEVSLTNFKFWGGARNRASRLTYEELQDIEYFINDYESEMDWSDVMLNDFIWFDEEVWLEWIGVSEEEFWAREPRYKYDI